MVACNKNTTMQSSSLSWPELHLCLAAVDAVVHLVVIAKEMAKLLYDKKIHTDVTILKQDALMHPLQTNS